MMTLLYTVGLTVVAYRGVLYLLSKSTHTAAKTAARILGAGSHGEE